MKKHLFALILEDCLQRLDRGESLPDLLAAYPDQADELKSLLLVAMASRAFPVPLPSQTAQRLGRIQMLGEMSQREIKKAFRKDATIPLTSRLMGGLVSALRARGFTLTAYSYRLAMISLVLILSGGFFTLNASASSQPGDLLYNLKLGMERASLIPSDTALEEKQLQQILPQPWEFGQTVWALEGITTEYQIEEESIADSFPGDQDEFSTADLWGQQEDKEDKEIEQEAEKEAAEVEKETAQDLKEAEKEAAEAAKEAAQDLKQAEKEQKEQEKEQVKAEKEVEKEEHKERKGQENTEQKAEEGPDETLGETRKREKEHDKVEKERGKEAKKKDK